VSSSAWEAVDWPPRKDAEPSHRGAGHDPSVALRPRLPHRTESVYHREMAERVTPPQSPSRYAAIAALFTALEDLMGEYRSDEAERVRRWSQDADRITGEVARQLAIARARISAAPHHDG
jgi:hypothetical protein